MVTSPHCLPVIIGGDVTNSTAEDVRIITAPGSTLCSSDWVSHLVTSRHLVAVGYFCLGIGYPGEELAGVERMANSAGGLTLCFISKVR